MVPCNEGSGDTLYVISIDSTSLAISLNLVAPCDPQCMVPSCLIHLTLDKMAVISQKIFSGSHFENE